MARDWTYDDVFDDPEVQEALRRYTAGLPLDPRVIAAEASNRLADTASARAVALLMRVGPWAVFREYAGAGVDLDVLRGCMQRYVLRGAWCSLQWSAGNRVLSIMESNRRADRWELYIAIRRAIMTMRAELRDTAAAEAAAAIARLDALDGSLQNAMRAAGSAS